MHAYLWINWKVSSHKLKSFNLLCSLGTLMIFSPSELMVKTVKNFMMEFNNFNPNIKFTYEFSEESINFLDLNVKFSSGKLQTSLYVKPTDCHQYLHFQSSHPKHTKKSIVYSQTLRVSRHALKIKIIRTTAINKIMVPKAYLSREPD